jgi:hypothetical protein
MDIRYVIENLELQHKLSAPDFANIDADGVDQLITTVEEAVKNNVLSLFDQSSKLYLLHARREMGKGKKPELKILSFRHYLLVANHDHRRSLTRILLSNHIFALERLRWTESRRPKIDRHLRLCRLCRSEVESPEHAILQCDASAEVSALRREFVEKVAAEIPTIQGIMLLNPQERFRALLSQKHVTGLLAKLCHDVSIIFDSVAMYIPPVPLTWLIRDTDGTNQFLD